MTTRRPSTARPRPAGAPLVLVARHDHLWRAFRISRSRPARNRLVLAFGPLVRDVASRTRRGLPASVDVSDLESDGYIGLIDAVEKYEPRAGRDFRAYAVPRIRGAIIDGLRAADWVPRSVRRKIRVLNTASAELERRLDRPPSDDEMAAELGVTRTRLRVIRAQTSYTRLVSLEAGAIGDRLGMRAEDGEDGRAGVVRDAVRALPERQRRVISLSYWGRLTLQEIGQVLGLSESRVSQLRTQARHAIEVSLSRRDLPPGTRKHVNRVDASSLRSRKP